MRVLHAVAAVTLLAACTTTPASDAPERSAPSPAPVAGPTTYLALGDSVAAGVGADVPSRGGYVPVLAGRLSDRLGCAEPVAPGCPLQLRNLAVAGATTTTLLRNQLPAALDLLAEDDVRLVTVTIGGNDVFVPIVRACAPEPDRASCRQAVQDSLRRVDEGVDRLLARLTSAAPNAVVAVMTYYNPVPSCQLAPLASLAAQVLEGSAQERGLNDVLRARAEEHGAVVVDTAESVAGRGDVVGGTDCLHPSGAGHVRIAEAFEEQVSPRLSRAVRG